jgi:hypothetical protein
MDSDNDDKSSADHQIPTVPEVKETGEDAEQFSDPMASPSVLGEENVFSGDAPEGEPADIDDELAKLGLENDSEGVRPLSSDDID